MFKQSESSNIKQNSLNKLPCYVHTNTFSFSWLSFLMMWLCKQTKVRMYFVLFSLRQNWRSLYKIMSLTLGVPESKQEEVIPAWRLRANEPIRFYSPLNVQHEPEPASAWKDLAQNNPVTPKIDFPFTQIFINTYNVHHRRLRRHKTTKSAYFRDMNA